jgi:hypothetical protein
MNSQKYQIPGKPVIWKIQQSGTNPLFTESSFLTQRKYELIFIDKRNRYVKIFFIYFSTEFPPYEKPKPPWLIKGAF